MPLGPLQVTVAVSSLSAILSLSSLSVVASHLMSGGRVTWNDLGGLLLYASQPASLIASESWNLSPGLATLGPSDIAMYSLMAAAAALALASRASRSAGVT